MRIVPVFVTALLSASAADLGQVASALDSLAHNIARGVTAREEVVADANVQLRAPKGGRVPATPLPLFPSEDSTLPESHTDTEVEGLLAAVGGVADVPGIQIVKGPGEKDFGDELRPIAVQQLEAIGDASLLAESTEAELAPEGLTGRFLLASVGSVGLVGSGVFCCMRSSRKNPYEAFANHRGIAPPGPGIVGRILGKPKTTEPPRQYIPVN